MSPDWTRFRVRIDVSAPVDRIYECWATATGMEYWFLRRCLYINGGGEMLAGDEPVGAGDTYRWLWYGYSDEVDEKGRVLEANARDTFRFEFGKAGICTARIYEELGTTMVELTQEQIPTDEQGRYDFHLGCKGGWTFYLANLKSLLEGGIDLRNKREELKWVINS